MRLILRFLSLSFLALPVFLIAGCLDKYSSKEGSELHYESGYLLAALALSQFSEESVLDSSFSKGFQDALKDIKAGKEIDWQEKNQHVTRLYEESIIDPNELEQNMTKEVEFFEALDKEDGIQSLDNGVRFRVTESGSGDKPSDSDIVKVHYSGSFIDGSIFDSSIERGEPVDFPVSGVVEGFKTSLLDMQPGEKRTVYIPHELGYGSSGIPPTIPPASTLIFDIELIEIVN